jgi:hypothetical protein
MPALEKVCGASQHDMTTCQDPPFRYNVRVPYVVRKRGNSMADSPETEKIFVGRVDAHLFQNGHFAPIFEV